MGLDILVCSTHCVVCVDIQSNKFASFIHPITALNFISSLCAFGLEAPLWVIARCLASYHTSCMVPVGCTMGLLTSNLHEQR